MLHLVVDSMSDITQVLGHETGMTVIPLSVQFGEETYLDGVTIDVTEFYQKMREADKLPKTSQAAPDGFRKAFKKALENEKDEVLCITGSSVLSGTYQSACIARDAFGEGEQRRIFIVDSLSATIGEALMVRVAVSYRDQGMGGQALFETLTALKDRVAISATVGDLKYLVMGGRLPAIGAKVGGLLNLKPMIRLTEGAVKTAGVSRGTKKVQEWLKDDMLKSGVDEEFPIVLGHADAFEDMMELKTYFEKEKVCQGDMVTMDIGSVIGSHTGPGTYGVAWVKK